MKQEIQDISDKDAGIIFCHRCSKDTKSFYRWWQRKNRGYFIKVCGECHYSPYQECKEAEPMEEKEEYKHKFIDFIQGKHKKTLEIETELLNLIDLYTDSLKKRIEELEDLLRIEREANKNKAPF